MTRNLWIWPVTVAIYYTLWISFFGESLSALFVIAIASLPINIDGNIYTLIGNAHSEKSVYSLFSIFQIAEDGKAGSLLGLIQVSFDGSTFSFFGSLFQVAANGSSVVFVGFSLIQLAHKNAEIYYGISLLQHASENAVLGIGFPILQFAGKETSVLFGLAIYQRVENKSRALAVFSSLEA